MSIAEENMLTEEERENLQDLLRHAVKPEDAMSLDELEGYLFGVVITPDVTMPSEWFGDIFGEEMAAFENEREGNRIFGYLMDAYNRLNARRLAGELSFPFDIDALGTEGMERMRLWANGLEKALALRSGIWAPDEVLDAAEVDEDQEGDDVLTALMIVLGVARPDHVPEIFDNVGPGEDEIAQVSAKLIALLPSAVETLQAFASEIEEIRLEDSESEPPAKVPVATARVGRNESCPCGSGKKYKKCCGLN